MKNSMESTLKNCEIKVSDENIRSLSKENDQVICHMDSTNYICKDIYNQQAILQKSIKIVKESHNNDINASNLQMQEKPLKSLSIIALEYGNYSDEEDMEVDIDKNINQNIEPSTDTINLQQYRDMKLSSEESDEDDTISVISISSSSSSSSSSNSSSKNITHNNNRKQIRKQKKIKESENEFQNLPPIEDLRIHIDEVSCKLFGKISKIVDDVVIVKPIPDVPMLNIDTVLFMDKGQRTLGKIIDVYGSLNEPYYCIRFNDLKHIQKCNIKVNMEVYYASDTNYTSILFPHELKKIKHSDTIDEDEAPMFSDDEEEQNYQIMQRDKSSALRDSMPQKEQSNSRKKHCRSVDLWNKITRSQFIFHQEKQQIYQNHNNPIRNERYPFLAAPRLQYPFQNNRFCQRQSGIPFNDIPYARRTPDQVYERPCNPNIVNVNQHYRSVEPNFQFNMFRSPRTSFGPTPVRFNPMLPPYMYAYPVMSTHMNATRPSD